MVAVLIVRLMPIMMEPAVSVMLVSGGQMIKLTAQHVSSNVPHVLETLPPTQTVLLAQPITLCLTLAYISVLNHVLLDLRVPLVSTQVVLILRFCLTISTFLPIYMEILEVVALRTSLSLRIQE
jgi:hypothetical protein